jgi:hypothetical protein
MDEGPITVAYADPPYLGQCGRYEHNHPDGRCWDDPDTHTRLVARLSLDFPGGWLLSLSVPSLRAILPVCPDDCRVGAWVKTYCVYKPNVNPAYAWEPVIWRGGRKRARRENKVRDYHSCGIRQGKNFFFGAKPDGFCFWLFDLLGLRPGDTFVDLFPGSGAVTRAWEKWCRQQDGLFAVREAAP